MPNVHASILQSARGFATEIIIAARADKRNFRARSRRCDGLVGAFATGKRLELSAQNRFARARQSFAVQNQISVRATDDHNAILRRVLHDGDYSEIPVRGILISLVVNAR
jgi:hypothetical protein